MAPILPTIEPTEATAGSTWTWKILSSSYPVAEGWVLSYAVAGLSTLVWSAAWLAADGQTVTIPAASTSLDPGRYEITRIWTGAGPYAGQKYTEALPTLAVAPNPSFAAPGDRVRFAEKALAYVEAALLGRYADDMPLEYTIGGRMGGRSVRKMDLAELKRARIELQAELRKLSGRTRRTVRIRFTEAGR